MAITFVIRQYIFYGLEILDMRRQSLRTPGYLNKMAVAFVDIAADSDSEDELPLAELFRRNVEPDTNSDSDEEDTWPLARLMLQDGVRNIDQPPDLPPLPQQQGQGQRQAWLDMLSSCYRHSEWLGDFVQQTGPRQDLALLDEYQVFSSLVNDQVIDLLVLETNRYAQQYLDAHPNLPPCSRAKKWKPTDNTEMRAFLGILCVMGYIKFPSYHSYWNTDSMTEMPGFRKLMSRDRWLVIWEFLHVVNNDMALPRDDPNVDKIFKIRPFMELVLKNWQEHYTPSVNVSVDESIIAYKGRTRMMQYMPAKPHKWGVKAWVLAEAKTGYIYNWDIYRGAEAGNTEGGITQRVVMNITKPLHHKNYHVYMDNFFSSPNLYQALADVNMGACGTLRSNRVGVPPAIKNAKLPKGAPPITVRDGIFQYIAWQDKKMVNILTTLHNAETCMKQVRCKDPNTNFIREIVKPKAVECYNQYMSGVDLVDQKLVTYLSIHRTVKWWKKVFVYLLEASFVNASIIWKALHPDERFFVDKFRMAVIRGLIEGYERPIANPGRRYSTLDPHNRLIEKHFLMMNTDKTPKGKPAYPDCEVCSDRNKPKGRRQTNFMCKQCRVPLHPVTCFERYHTLMNYKMVVPQDPTAA